MRGDAGKRMEEIRKKGNDDLQKLKQINQQIKQNKKLASQSQSQGKNLVSSVLIN